MDTKSRKGEKDVPYGRGEGDSVRSGKESRFLSDVCEGGITNACDCHMVASIIETVKSS